MQLQSSSTEPQQSGQKPVALFCVQLISAHLRDEIIYFMKVMLNNNKQIRHRDTKLMQNNHEGSVSQRRADRAERHRILQNDHKQLSSMGASSCMRSLTGDHYITPAHLWLHYVQSKLLESFNVAVIYRDSGLHVASIQASMLGSFSHDQINFLLNYLHNKI